MAALSREDLTMAAQSSYAYWVSIHSDCIPTEEQMQRMALKEARRHIYMVKYEDAVNNLRETCKFRRVR